ATGIENKQQIDKLHVFLIDSKEQQEVLKTALKEIGQQRLQLETKWSDEHQRAEQLSLELSATREQKASAEASQHDQWRLEKETTQQEFLLALMEKESRLQEVTATGIENKQQIDKLHVSLIDSKEQQEALKTALKEIGQQRLQLEMQVQALHQKETQLDVQLSKKEDAINWLNNEWDAAKHKIDELHQSSHHWWSMADQHSKELDEVRNKSDELNHSSHHWWLEADSLSKELQTLYNSKSWRITWPLRKLMLFLKWMIFLPIRSVLWLARLPKRLARWLVVKFITFALERPSLRVRMIAWVRNHPRIEAKLRRLAQAHGLVAVQSGQSILTHHVQGVAQNDVSTSDADLSSLTPSARRIYGELNAALEQLQQEKG
ncbi:MAG: uncharacterized coiled-coil DUF342 family protein, partial [Paraglaciecola sp.]